MQQKTLNRREGWLLVAVAVVLVAVSGWQSGQLRAIQHEMKRAHYVERVRTAQLVLESEMLRAAYFTAIDRETKRLAKRYLERFPE